MSAAPGIGNPAYISPGDFEPVYAALFALLQGALEPLSMKWITSSRLLRHWADVEGKYQPAMFQSQINEEVIKRVGQPAQWVLNLKVYVYAQSKDDNSPSAPVMNPLLGAIRTVLSPDKSGPGRAMYKQTLGGLVDDVYISGRIDTDEGMLGQQAVAIIPLRIIQNGI